MTIQSMRQRFLTLLHSTMDGHVDLYVPVDSHEDYDRCSLLVGGATVDLSNTHLNAEMVGSPERTQIAFRALDEMINGHAPEYWRRARALLREQQEPGAKPISEQERLDAEVLCALGWVDRRVGNRSLDNDRKVNGFQAFSPLEEQMQRLRMHLFNPPVPGRGPKM